MFPTSIFQLRDNNPFFFGGGEGGGEGGSYEVDTWVNKTNILEYDTLADTFKRKNWIFLLFMFSPKWTPYA